MTALRIIGLRLLKSVAVILAIVALNFLLIRIAPGDPASTSRSGGNFWSMSAMSCKAIWAIPIVRARRSRTCCGSACPPRCC